MNQAWELGLGAESCVEFHLRLVMRNEDEYRALAQELGEKSARWSDWFCFSPLYVSNVPLHCLVERMHIITLVTFV